jgi:PAS domain S-box-containing protein
MALGRDEGGLFRRIAGVRLGIAIQVFTTLLILVAGYLVVEGTLQELARANRPVTPYQLRQALLTIRMEVVAVAFVAFVSGLILTYTIQRELKRATMRLERISRGNVTPEVPRDLSREFVPLNSAIRDLGDALGRLLERSVTDAIVLVNEDLTIEVLNPTAELLLGHRSEDVSGKPVEMIFPAGRGNEALYAWLKAGKGDDGQLNGPFTGNAVTHKGEWIPVRLTGLEVHREGKSLRGIVAGAFDPSQWQRLREEFDRADRLSTLGLLVAGLAHEIKNPLGAIHGLVQMLAEDVPADHPRRRYHETILREVERLDDIVKRLLDLASPSRWESAPLSVGEVVRDAASLMGFEAERRGVTLIGGTTGPDPWVTGDRDRIRQAVINVIKNALEATPPGGLVHWDVGVEGEWAVVEVSNPGESFPEEVTSRVPGVFRSSKIGGSGLGLAITHQILQHHRGHVQVRNREEGGAVVRLLFPAGAPDRGPGPAFPEAPSGGPGGRSPEGMSR